MPPRFAIADDATRPAGRGGSGHLRRLLLSTVVASLLFPFRASAQSPAGFLLDFSKAERQAILQLGPWPPAAAADPGNRVSGEPAAIAFGERLFFDARLSASGAIACASCHVPEKGWTDGRRVADGLARTVRNTPTLLNVRFQRWFGWDGANDSLWSQSVRPLLDAREMGGDERSVARLVRDDAGLACRYGKVFGGLPPGDDEAVMVNVSKALAAFQETLVSGRTPFDEFRDALERDDREAAARYPMDAQRGLRIFVGQGSCSLCHAGPAFTDGEFHGIGIPLAADGGRDAGRYDGIGKLRASRYNRLGRFNDDPARSSGAATEKAVPLPRTFGQFKVPNLRNVALTSPYMHNGHFAGLADVVRHYSSLDPASLDASTAPLDPLLKPLKLTTLQISYMVAFLETLTDPGARAPRKPVPDPTGCP